MGNDAGVSRAHAACLGGRCCNRFTRTNNAVSGCRAHSVTCGLRRVLGCGRAFNGRGIKLVINRRCCRGGCCCLDNAGSGLFSCSGRRLNKTIISNTNTRSCVSSCGSRNCFVHTRCSCTNHCFIDNSCHHSTSSHFRPSRH